ncbi:hypothetical protein WA158_003597 [Blastocystis sp. Blastoise]
MNVELSFKLDPEFLEPYKHRTPPFGFNGLGEIVYRRTYSRVKNDGTNEDWWETIQRVVEGTYSIQKDYIQSMLLGWNDNQGQASAQEMYNLMFNMKFLPPGRGLWCMGTAVVHKKNLSAALNNCAFVSTEDILNNPTRPFTFLMDASMLGVGVGFDTKGAGKVSIIGPLETESVEYIIDDSREGWVDSVEALLLSYIGENGQQLPSIRFNYDEIRPAGKILKTFGGYSSGPKPLMDLHNSIIEILNERKGTTMTSTDIVDIFNLIGKCVVSGNIRRTAEIAFGEPEDKEFLDLKNYEKNPRRMAFGWSSNNSVFAKIGMDYKEIAERIQINGEPGLAWLSNMQQYGRMEDPANNKDSRVKGGNPCLEQSLESYELCCLVETFPARHTSLQEYLRTLKFAYLYAKTVTLRMTHWPETNRVMLRNRRIGCSVSGVAQFLAKHSLDELKVWLDEGYHTIQHWDDVYSSWFCIPHSIKTTSVKPSGTVSLLAGATPGMHFPESRTYLRRIRVAKDSALLIPIREAGYVVDPAVGQEDTTVVVEIPVKIEEEGIRTINEVSMFEQLSLAAFMQRYWADNQVSCTITFDKKTEGPHIAHMLQFFQYQLKGVSMLPKFEKLCYPQLPYEEVSEEFYNERMKNVKPIVFFDRGNNPIEDTTVPFLPVLKEPLVDGKNVRGYTIKTLTVKGGYTETNEAPEVIQTVPESQKGEFHHVFPDDVSFCTNEKCQL